MKQYSFSRILLAVLAWISLSMLSTNAIAQARWGFGFGPSMNSLYSDLKKTSIGVGGMGYVTRRFNSRLGLTGFGSYNQLPFTKRIPNTAGQATAVKFTTTAITGDLLFDYELATGNVRPYIGVGIGGVNYKTSGTLNGAPLKSPKSLTSFTFGPSLGFRVMIGSRYAIDLGGSFRMSTTDKLDMTATNKAKDSIISGMLGFTFFGGSQATDMFADDELLQETESKDTQDDLTAFQERIDQMEAAPAQEQPQDMQEYVRLKSKMDEMNQEINQKEAEISSLRNTLADKQDNVDNLQTQLTSTPMTSASFSRGYEEALSKFYGKRYAEAIQQFNALAAQFPDHPRVSNCVYWVGESQFGSGSYQEAATTFNRVIDYPRSLKKDDALLMLGRSLMQLNQREEARQAFNRLIQEFPNSEFVAKAESYLSKL